MTSPHACTCGFEAASAEELADHLAEVFTPDDDQGSDGMAHAELSRPGSDGTLLECQCGLTTVELASLEAHLASVFTPASRTSRDGIRHAPALALAPGE